MNKLGFVLGLWLAVLASASAQVRVEVQLDQEQFLPGETMSAAVRITNRSGQTLKLGGQEDWLTFSIESPDGQVVRKLDEAPVLGEFTLETAKMATKRVNLAPYFSLDQPGRYSLIATVKIKDWDNEVSSPPRGFNIIQGARLWEQEFGVPIAGASSNTPPEVRKYTLQQANYLKAYLRLYLRVTDVNSGKSIRVRVIGQTLSFSRPEAQVDKTNNVHILYQSAPHAHMYTVYDPDGNLLLRQTYDYVTARPRLAIDAEGKLGVAGGVRHESSTDFPAPKEPPLEVELGLGTNGVPAGTNSVPATNSPPASTNGPAAHP